MNERCFVNSLEDYRCLLQSERTIKDIIIIPGTEMAVNERIDYTLSAMRPLWNRVPIKRTDMSPRAIYTELATRTSVADSGMGVLGKGAGGAGRAKAHALGDSSSVKDAEEARITFTEALASRSGCSVGVGLPGRHTSDSLNQTRTETRRSMRDARAHAAEAARVCADARCAAHLPITGSRYEQTRPVAPGS